MGVWRIMYRGRGLLTHVSYGRLVPNQALSPSSEREPLTSGRWPGRTKVQHKALFLGRNADRRVGAALLSYFIFKTARTLHHQINPPPAPFLSLPSPPRDNITTNTIYAAERSYTDSQSGPWPYLASSTLTTSADADHSHGAALLFYFLQKYGRL